MKLSVGIADLEGQPEETSGAVDDAADPRTISFVHPVPGFPGLREFALVGLDADDEPGALGSGTVLYELRSLERPEVRFMVATAYAFFPDYDVAIDDQTCENLQLADAADVLVLVILTLGPDIASTTANLLAPVIVNSRTRSAAQVILSGSEWPVRAPLG